MKRATVALIACAALAGCGSSSSSSSTSATSASTAPTSSNGGLKPNTTPQFAAPPANAAVETGTVQIAYRNIAIAPDTVKVKVGSTVKWTNFDSVDHNVTTAAGSAQSFASKNFGENGTFEVKVEKPGLLHYTCTIHPASMNGTIDVVK